MAAAIEQNGTNSHRPIAVTGDISLAPLFDSQGQLLPQLLCHSWIERLQLLERLIYRCGVAKQTQLLEGQSYIEAKGCQHLKTPIGEVMVCVENPTSQFD
jgi:meiotically up-regulated gene 157 (Mug157) protein